MVVLHILTDQEVEAGMRNQGPSSIFKGFPLITYFCQPDSMSQRSSQPPRTATPTGNQVLKTWVCGRDFTFRLKHCLEPVKSNQALLLPAAAGPGHSIPRLPLSLVGLAFTGKNTFPNGLLNRMACSGLDSLMWTYVSFRSRHCHASFHRSSHIPWRKQVPGTVHSMTYLHISAQQVTLFLIFWENIRNHSLKWCHRPKISAWKQKRLLFHAPE